MPDSIWKKPITHLDNFELTYRTLVEWQIGAQASTTTAGRAACEKHPVYHHPNPKPHREQHQHSEVLTMQRYFTVSDWDSFLVSTTIAYEIERHAYMGTWFKNRLPAEAVFGTRLLLCGPSC
jgi:hypothetical protein